MNILKKWRHCKITTLTSPFDKPLYLAGNMFYNCSDLEHEIF